MEKESTVAGAAHQPAIADLLPVLGQPVIVNLGGAISTRWDLARGALDFSR
jgi:hypothetical protein